MRQLRFVGPAEDADHLILEATDGGERFRLLIDSALRSACQADLPRISPIAPEPTTQISPREIQTRVRAGETPQQLADEYDVPLDRVMRFAEPVLAERSRITDEARRARARRNGEGAFVGFGEAVDARFGTYGIDASLVRWDSRRREDGQWVVIASWVGGLDTADDHSAEWTLNLASRTVTPLDDVAADLLSDRPITPVAPTQVVEPLRPTLAPVPPIAPGVARFPAMPDAKTGPLPGLAPVEQVFDQAQFDDETPSTGSHSADSAPAASVQMDELPLGLTPPPSAPPPSAPPASAPPAQAAPSGQNPYVVPEDHADKAERARIPSWDDILLGVRRKSD